MIKFHLIVRDVFKACLAYMVISAHHFEHDLASNTTPSWSAFFGFGRSALHEKYGAGVPEYSTSHFYRIVIADLLGHPWNMIFEPCDGFPNIVLSFKRSGKKFCQDGLVVCFHFFWCAGSSRSWKHFNQLAIRAIFKLPARLTDRAGRKALLSASSHQK